VLITPAIPLTHAELRNLALAVLAVFIAILLSACETGGPSRTALRSLPAYEMPVGHSEFQSVRMTAYTHTEADHTIYTNHNALGGQLQAASPPNRRAENVRRAIPVAMTDDEDQQHLAYTSARRQPFAMEETKTVTTKRVVKMKNGKKKTVVEKRVVKVKPKIGSAAADWSRWPAGTTFRLLSTGQMYRVDDYGWALSGRNTIDLYMASPRDMNSWGARTEPIQVLQWGDPKESYRLLQPHQASRHIRRMMLELEGKPEEAAALH
jgi:3D (Asp-Asp-Asp) domain-containing protein